MIDHDEYYTDTDGTPLYAVRPIDPTTHAALVRCDDGRTVEGEPWRCPSCGGVVLLDGTVEGPSADLACAMRSCPRRAGASDCGGRLWAVAP